MKLNLPILDKLDGCERILIAGAGGGFDIFAGLPLVSHGDEHVTMDFIDRLLPRSALLALVRAVHLLCAGIMGFLAWQVWIKADTISGYGDTTDVLRILIGPFVYFMSLMIGLTGLVHLFKVFAPGGTAASQATT